jgi:pSer/pThr/pTyr-binding forkhead associated (FHA) protein
MGAVIIASGNQQGLFIPLGKKVSVIGRDEAAGLQVEDDQVSRKHLQIRFDPATSNYVALDMKSSNGTLLNGRPLLSETVLADGDQITLGNTPLLYTTEIPTDKVNAMAVLKKIGERRRSTLIK